MDHYFITGVSSGIGLALVNELLLESCDLFIHGCSRRDPGIKDPRFRFYRMDLSDTKKLEKQAIEFFKVKSEKDDRYILINNAGMLGRIAFVGQQLATHYTQTFAVNTLAPIILCEAFVQHFQETTAEKLIFNISSGAATKDIEGWAAYCASKSALDRFTSVAAQEQTHKHKPIQMYSVSPGVIDTAMQAEIRTASKSQFPSLDRFVNLHRQGELIPPAYAAQKIILLIKKPDLRLQTLLSLRNV